MKKDELIDHLKEVRDTLYKEIEKVIVGQKDIIELMLISLFVRGHCIIVGVPGLAKTMLISSFARILNLDFKRIQFTPDLMPSDIIGIDILEEQGKAREFKFIKGPIFTNILLADEINRTPPKTQSALLQAMQEYKVTVAGKNYEVLHPFFVLATQNPIEQEGTYPLPEAQLDRFLFMLNIDYPSFDEEVEIVKRTTGNESVDLKPLLNKNQILKVQEIVRDVPVSDSVVKFAAKLISNTRPGQKNSLDFINKWVRWGAGPRATQSLVLAAKARAILDSRYMVSIEDIKSLALPVLRHRIILSFNAEADGVSIDEVIKKLVDNIKE